MKEVTKNKTLRLFFVMVLIITFIMGCQPRAGKYPPGSQPQKDFKNEPKISIYMHETGKVKQMMLEDYLQGVVAAEMNPKWPVNALAAQAIIARSYTLAKIKQGGVKKRGTDVSTDIEEFQAYDATAVNDNVKKAVQMTRGMVATYQGDYILGWFHSYSGGKTATAGEGLGYNPEPPYIKMVDDIDVSQYAEKDVLAWKAVFPQSEVLKFVNKATGAGIDRISSIKISARGPSGRATKITVNGTATVSAPEMRIALGSEKLKSMLLTNLSLQGNNVVFEGRGYGHGVGISQWGAYGMAKKGKKPEEIVNYYYKDIEIKKIWE